MRLTPSFNWRLASILAAVLTLLASCKPKEDKSWLEPTKALGIVLAEEAVHAAGAKKTMVIISPDTHGGPASTVEKALRDALTTQGISILSMSADVGSPMAIRLFGLKPDDFFAALDKGADAGAIISLAGAPLLNAADVGQPNGHLPPILVDNIINLSDRIQVDGNGQQLEGLLAAKIIQIAIVNGGDDAPAPAGGNTDEAHELFAKYYHILRAPQ